MKHMLAEAIGTFFLGCAIMLGSNALAVGLILMALIYVFGHVSGAYFNPALVFAAVARGSLSLVKAGMYVIAQTIGAAAAAGVFYVLAQTPFVVSLPPETASLIALVPETLFTVVFALVFLMMTRSGYEHGKEHAGLIIGLSLVGIASVGGIFNPAIVLGGMLASLIAGGAWDISSCALVHIVGPCCGALVATFLFKFFHE